MHLTRWQRIGLILSVVWVLAAGTYERVSDVKAAGDASNNIYEFCAKDMPADYVKSVCPVQAQDTWRLSLKNSWWNVAMAAFVPLPVLWLAAISAIGLLRWVKAGPA